MKKSYYNYFFEYKGKKYVYNSLSGAFAETDNEFELIMEKIDNNELMDESKTYDQMKKAGIIVDDDFDEVECYKDFFIKSKKNEYTCTFTIAPSFSCNFRCPYCYESKNNYVMSEENIKKLINFIKKSLFDKKDCFIMWYGGEPLICKDIIFKISEEIVPFCEKNNISYSAGIVTNGYLITDEILMQLKKYKVVKAQITLDGDRIHHNKKRFLFDGKGSYDVILKNIKKVDESGIKLNIRINVDKTNEECMDNVFNDLKKLELKNTYIYFGFIYASTDACASISNSCMTTQQFSKNNILWNLKLYSMGLFTSMLKVYPSRTFSPCAALSNSSFVIDSKGNFYKCWDDIGNETKRVGTLESDTELPFKPSWNLNKYVDWTPFQYEECCKCKVLPICGGNCAYLALREGKPQCVKWKYTLEDYLKNVLDSNLNS